MIVFSRFFIAVFYNFAVHFCKEADLDYYIVYWNSTKDSPMSRSRTD